MNPTEEEKYEALYAFIKEGCAQKGEPYSRDDFLMFKNEHTDDWDDEMFQMQAALKVFLILRSEKT